MVNSYVCGTVRITNYGERKINFYRKAGRCYTKLLKAWSKSSLGRTTSSRIGCMFHRLREKGKSFLGWGITVEYTHTQLHSFEVQPNLLFGCGSGSLPPSAPLLSPWSCAWSVDLGV